MLANNDHLMKLGAGEATLSAHMCEPAFRRTFRYVPLSNVGAYSGTIAAGVADEILELTHAGVNRITVGDQTYRFVRSFTHTLTLAQ